MRIARWKDFPFVILTFVSILAFHAAFPGSVEAGKTKTFYADTDTDGYGDPNNTVTGNKPPPGYVRNGDDCNDTDSAINPGAPEVCGDGIDQNCDGSDEPCGGGTTYYQDADGDGYGNPDVSVTDTSPPPGYTIDDTDCDDTEAAVNPGAIEVCGDGIDQNCNGEIDEGCQPEPSGNRLEWNSLNPTVVQQGATWQEVKVIVLKNGIQDWNDNRTLVTLSLSPGATGTLSGTLTRTAVDGTVTFPGLYYDTAETITLLATPSSKKFDPVVSDPIVVATSVSLEFETQPGSPQAIDEVWSPTFSVRIMADGVHGVTDNATLVTVSASAGAAGVLSGSLTMRAVDGVASFGQFDNIRYSSGPETITLDAVAWNPLFTPALSDPVWVKDKMTVDLQASFPSNGETGVPLRTFLSVTFSEAVDPASLTSASYYLTGPGGIVPGSYAFSAGNTVVDLIPDVPLATGTSYTWTVTDGGVTDSYGFPMANTLITASFTTEDAGWGWPVTVNRGFSYDDIYPVVRLDAAYSRSGEALVVYENTGGGINYRFFHETWIRPSGGIFLEKYGYWDLDYQGLPGIVGNSSFPDVGMDDLGNAVVTYIRAGSALEVRAVTYDAATGSWSSPTILGSVGDPRDYPVLAMNGSGMAVAAWAEPVGGSFQVMASRFVPGSGWEPAEAVSALMSLRPAEPVEAAINSWGEAAVVWNEQDTSGGRSVYAANFQATALEWRPPVLLGQHYTDVAPQVGIDEAGQAIGIFAGIDGMLYARHYDGFSWGAPVSPSFGPAASPRLSVSPQGDATLVIQYYNDFDGIWQTEARHYTGGSWEGGGITLGPFRAATTTPAVARDGNGNATVIYSSDGSVYVSRYVAGAGWQDTFGQYLGTGQGPMITMNPYGNVMATFKSGDDGTAWRFVSGQ